MHDTQHYILRKHHSRVAGCRIDAMDTRLLSDGRMRTKHFGPLIYREQAELKKETRKTEKPERASLFLSIAAAFLGGLKKFRVRKRWNKLNLGTN